jgi:BirA family biotin operon repressor/biotin-[acetyl-CoA-carboxylase] ligase
VAAYKTRFIFQKIPFKKGIQDLSGLSLACGLAVVKGISSATSTSKEDLQKMGLGLKWPNDILLNQI